jgi:branched-chain amino acid transport system substrate-binding protein
MLLLALVPAYAQPAAPKTIKIGAMYDITGPIAITGERFGWGLKKAIEAVNKDGGIYVKQFDKKIPLQLVEADHTNKEDKAVLQAEYLNDQGVVALIATTSCLPTAASVYERNQLPTLASISSNDAPFHLGYKYLFSNFPKFSDIARTFIGLLNSLPKEKRPSLIALFEVQYDAGIDACKSGEKEAIASGYKIVRVKFGWLTKDMSGAILEAKKAGADAVYSMAITPDAMLMIKQMKELDYNPKAIFIIQGPMGRAAWMTLKKDGDYVYTVNHSHWNVGWPGARELAAMYEAERKEKPYEHSPNGYASIQIIADAIKRAGSVEREKVRDALATTDMMTVMGPIKFRANGTMEIKYANTVQFQNGVETVVFPEMWRERLPIYPAPQWKER